MWETLRTTARDAGLVRGGRALLHVNQPDGFDCPGCAWPDPDDPSRLEFCENGAEAIAHEATTRRVDAAFFDEWPRQPGGQPASNVR